jgi:hypothetical protein
VLQHFTRPRRLLHQEKERVVLYGTTALHQEREKGVMLYGATTLHQAEGSPPREREGYRAVRYYSTPPGYKDYSVEYD